VKLQSITEKRFQQVLEIHNSDGGNSINDSLLKLFECMNDDFNRYEVNIRVAALNQIYSTAILHISPVVDKIIEIVPKNHNTFNEIHYVKLVDKISSVRWKNTTTGKEYFRCNLSFSSKYIHFLSNLKIPIYDSYIWIIMIGYLKQTNKGKYSFSTPKNYEEFYNIFLEFKTTFNLEDYSNYNIDKYLWQYGKNMINEIIEREKIPLSKAKSILKHEISDY